eukprot:3813711-Lingulodinium_polyedra.AAC.1
MERLCSALQRRPRRPTFASFSSARFFAAPASLRLVLASSHKRFFASSFALFLPPPSLLPTAY